VDQKLNLSYRDGSPLVMNTQPLLQMQLQALLMLLRL
jgi:hypothetical protein